MPLAATTPPFHDLWRVHQKKIQLSRFNYADTDLMGGQINYSTDVLWSVAPYDGISSHIMFDKDNRFDTNVNRNSGYK